MNEISQSYRCLCIARFSTANANILNIFKVELFTRKFSFSTILYPLKFCFRIHAENIEIFISHMPLSSVLGSNVPSRVVNLSNGRLSRYTSKGDKNIVNPTIVSSSECIFWQLIALHFLPTV